MEHFGLGSKRAHLHQQHLEVMAVLPQTPSKQSHPDPHPSFTHHTPTQALLPRLGRDHWFKSVFSLVLAMHGNIRFSTLGRREQGPAHLCCLHLAGEPTFHFCTGAQAEGLQRTICMPIYITQYWIVISCVLILWIFFLKLNIFYCWTAGPKCRVSLCHLDKPHHH